MQHKQYDKAVHLLVEGKKIAEAIDMATQHKVKITDDMAEKLTPNKVDESSEAAVRERNELLCKLAHLCKKQGSYHLATKKYTQV